MNNGNNICLLYMQKRRSARTSPKRKSFSSKMASTNKKIDAWKKSQKKKSKCSCCGLVNCNCPSNCKSCNSGKRKSPKRSSGKRSSGKRRRSSPKRRRSSGKRRRSSGKRRSSSPKRRSSSGKRSRSKQNGGYKKQHGGAFLETINSFIQRLF